MYIGAHLNKDKTILNTLKNIKEVNGNSLQIFISSPLTIKLTDINKFKNEYEDIRDYCNTNNIKLVIHGPYVLNIAKEFTITVSLSSRPLISDKIVFRQTSFVKNYTITNNSKI